MALTKAQQKNIAGHKKRFGAKHASVMKREIEKGASLGAAHKKALRE